VFLLLVVVCAPEGRKLECLRDVGDRRSHRRGHASDEDVAVPDVPELVREYGARSRGVSSATRPRVTATAPRLGLRPVAKALA